MAKEQHVVSLIHKRERAYIALLLAVDSYSHQHYQRSRTSSLSRAVPCVCKPSTRVSRQACENTHRRLPLVYPLGSIGVSVTSQLVHPTGFNVHRGLQV